MSKNIAQSTVMILEGIITSKTRSRLLLKFFLNPNTVSYLRQLSSEFNGSTNSIRLELNSLTNAKILVKEKDGNTIAYRANTKHPLFKEIHSIILKSVGIDKLIETIIQNIGKPDLILLTGDYANGIDSGIIDIVIVGKVEKNNLYKYTSSVEKIIKRKVRYLFLGKDEYLKLKEKIKKDGLLVLWETAK